MEKNEEKEELCVGAETDKLSAALPFWNKLSDAEQKLIREHILIRVFDKHSTVFSRGSECLGFIRVLSGSVRTYLTSEEGREVTLYHLRAGEDDVLSASCVVSQITFDTQMEAEGKSRILIVPSMVLARLKENNIYVRCIIYELLARRFSDVTWTFQEVLFLRIDQRIASWIVQTCEQSGSTEITVTHDQIARDINTAREVVARMIKRLAEEGMLRAGRGKIYVTDPNMLKKLCLNCRQE
ncbi:Crp/Fnr family transcriptional regulator [Bilifractor sp. HCP3S3_D3]|uniref:Crp/Fnr family transcriptional regulator n=1 Tax=Bilifractor sp. HCP3S3_D3 TaxID=3438907 RepID=UPI003F8A33C1|nr:Crp/Fnr family transcriptional regulator [Eubacterium sp.]